MPITIKPLPPLSDKDIARFWSHIDRRGPDECWLWTGYTTSKGYGQININDHIVRVHRVSYFLHYRQQPINGLVGHLCNSPACTNPSHLAIQTPAENSAYMVQCERQCRGSMASDALTEAQVVEIRRLYSAGGTTMLKLGLRFGTSWGNIAHIIRRDSWKHI